MGDGLSCLINGDIENIEKVSKISKISKYLM